MFKRIAMFCGAIVLGLTISLAAIASDAGKTVAPEKKAYVVTAEKMLADGKCSCTDCKCMKDGKCACTDKTKCECCKKCTMEKCKADAKAAKTDKKDVKETK